MLRSDKIGKRAHGIGYAMMRVHNDSRFKGSNWVLIKKLENSCMPSFNFYWSHTSNIIEFKNLEDVDRFLISRGV